MTSRHRERRIEENLYYVNGVVARLREQHTVRVFHKGQPWPLAQLCSVITAPAA
jgi:hypothetical protein